MSNQIDLVHREHWRKLCRINQLAQSVSLRPPPPDWQQQLAELNDLSSQTLTGLPTLPSVQPGPGQAAASITPATGQKTGEGDIYGQIGRVCVQIIELDQAIGELKKDSEQIKTDAPDATGDEGNLAELARAMGQPVGERVTSSRPGASTTPAAATDEDDLVQLASAMGQPIRKK